LHKHVFVICVVLVLFHTGCSIPLYKDKENFREFKYSVPQNLPRAEYTFRADIHTEEDKVHLAGSGNIVFTNTSGDPLSIIGLEWESGTLEVFDSGEKLEAVNEIPAEEEVVFYYLPRTYKSGKKLSIYIKFEMETKPYDNGDISLKRFYPKVWWDGLPTYDSFKVKLNVSPEFTVATSGKLNSKTEYYENPGVTTNFGIWLFRNINVLGRNIEGVKVKVYFSDEEKECALMCLKTAVETISFYKKIHGYFPFPSLTIIPGSQRSWGGYPYASALVMIHSMNRYKEAPELHWKWITAHEIAHQYWGETIMSDVHNDYKNSWLIIGMGIFADKLFVESKKLGDEKHDDFFKRYIGGVKNGFDITADAPDSLKCLQKYDRNNVLIHGKGYAIVSALRSVLGDKDFMRVYQQCVEKYRRKRMNYHDLRKIAEEESGKNLRWFFEQWVRSSKYLCYKITSIESRQKEKEYISEIIVELQGDSMLMPVTVKAIFNDDTIQKRQISRFLRKQKISFCSEAELKEVFLDPENYLAMLNEPPDELAYKLQKLPWKNSWDQGIALYREVLKTDLKDHNAWFKLGLVIFEGRYFEESFNCFQRILEMDPPEVYEYLAITWEGNIRDAQGRREEALKFYRKALEIADDKPEIQHEQFGIQTSKEWIKKRLVSSYNWESILKRT